MQMPDDCREILRALHGANAIELRLDGSKTFAVDGFLMHAGGVVIADFLVIRIRAGGGRGAFENLVENLAIALGEFAEPAPCRLVRRDRVVFQPGSAGVLVEVVARIGGPVDGSQIEPANGRRGAMILRKTSGREERGEGNRTKGV